MAQSVEKTLGKVIAKNEAVSVAASGNTDLLEIIVDTINELGVTILPTVQAFDAFLVLGKFHPDAAYVTLYSSAGAFTSPAGLVVDASGDLTTLAAAATGWVILDVRPLYAIKFQASAAAAGAATVSIYAMGRGFPVGT